MANRELFSLGELFISDFVREGEEPRGGKHELKLVMDEETRAVHLATSAPLNTMFGEYWYKSGLNESMRLQLKEIAETIPNLMKFNEGDIHLDIACNDGTLLSYVDSNFFTKIGIDPIEDKFKSEAEQHADLIIQDYFSAEVYKKSIFGNRKVSIITAIAVLYDIQNIDRFLKDIYEVLDDEGIFVAQLSHSGLMIDQCAFDNILSEHYWYWTLMSLNPYLDRNGFRIVDVTLNETNGGSFRIFIRKKIATDSLFATQPYRDVCKYRIESLIGYEAVRNFRSPAIWNDFYNRTKQLKETVTSYIKEQKILGNRVWAMAASTKGNTLLQYFELDNTWIDGICERNPEKYGLFTVCTNVKIFSEEEFKKSNPEFVLILAWHFVSSFMERYRWYLEGGGSFIIPCPKFKIITKEDL